MAFHIVLDKITDLDGIAAAAATGDRPGHAMGQLRDRLGAEVHAPDGDGSARWDDRIRSKLIGSPQVWALARKLASITGAGDTIFCTGEHSGFPVAALAGGRRDGPRVAMMVHNIDRTRARAALGIFGLKKRVDLFVSPSRPQIEYLAAAGYPPEQRQFIFDQTDLGFFSPGPAGPKRRSLVVSVGLEQRDYRTLAAATGELDLDVRISGFSNDAALLADTFPETMPANFERKFYEWRDLAQLYRDADVVVVAVKPNRYAAGVQALLEAMASGRPVIVTASEGLAGYLDDTDALTIVPQQDPAAMRRAIMAIVTQPETAAARRRRAREIAVERYGSDAYVGALDKALRHLR
ncbi:hypothetical protein ASG11_07885 [Sphingomonas sp. Leaf357]|uniref:glycosyltransferase n=1 Tax=Sphingomonas sp. Leaf357 TaxID=1736350 RepID=UPI0006F6C328|nr:glycosyltransferase [Sphingomonas sp. Leaf357]KQS04179.1 hypothetical protein ASG11_07885 [Sphingomonas sp. Leaf357]